MAVKKSFLLRIDPDLFDALQKWANDEFRSLNGQMEFVLREALRRAGRAPKKPDAGPLPDPDSEPGPGVNSSDP